MPDEQAGQEPVNHEEAHPRGALFLSLLFLIALVAMWGYVYVLMMRSA